jgi:hypothetical protein
LNQYDVSSLLALFQSKGERSPRHCNWQFKFYEHRQQR